MRVLISEMDVHGRRLLEQTLRLEGYEVFSAEAGTPLGNLVYKLRPDLVLLNVFFSQRIGKEPLQQIRVRRHEGSDPVVYVSCMGQCDDEEFVSMRHEAGAAAFDRLSSKAKILIVEAIQQLCATLIQLRRWAASSSTFAMKRCFSLDQFGNHSLHGLLIHPPCAHPA